MKSIKKTLCLLLTMLLLISAITPVMASNDIKVKIDGQQIAFDVPPQLINDRTMVPLRAIFEALGATVDWNNDTQTVTSTKGNTTIILTINNPTMYVNGAAVTLDSPACLVNGRTLVPVRAISEAFGTIVDWDGTTSTVSIISATSTNGTENFSANLPEPIIYATATDNAISLNWILLDDASYVSGYEIHQSTDMYNGFTLVHTINSRDMMSVIISDNIKKGVAYYFKVRPFYETNGVKYYGEFSYSKGATIKSEEGFSIEMPEFPIVLENDNCQTQITNVRYSAKERFDGKMTVDLYFSGKQLTESRYGFSVGSWILIDKSTGEIAESDRIHFEVEEGEVFTNAKEGVLGGLNQTTYILELVND